MMKHLILSAAVLSLSACAFTPPDVAYCKRYGELEGTPEFAACIDYFRTQTAAFERDLAICNEEADMTYPPSLYDYGGTEHASVYHHGHYDHVHVDVPPDYRQNAMIDDLRHRIVLPCMQSRGWQSANSWELGRIKGKGKR